MDAIEKRAREILAQNVGSLEVGGVVNPSGDLFLAESGVVQAIIAALKPPEGYVLVPVEPTEALLNNLCGRNLLDCNDEELRAAYVELLAARPEVP